MATTHTEEREQSRSQTGGLGRRMLAGTSALGAATAIERGLSFAATLLSARLGGTSVFGAYSLALATANSIAAYTGSGIGNTATRFAGAYRQDSPEYRPVARALLLVTAVSAGLAGLLMLAAAGPLARYVLENPSVTQLLRLSAFSAAAIISLECCRGFLIGQRKHGALLMVSVLAGLGLVAVLPLASRIGAEPMALGHGLVVLTAVLACIAFAGPLGLRPTAPNVEHLSIRPMIRKVWGFGIIQLGTLLSMNIAGWWMTSLLARGDTSLAQVGLFAVSHQIRNMAALPPSMLTQSSYALMIDGGAHTANDSVSRVVAVCTVGANLAALLLAGIGMVAAPWALPVVYGSAYEAAVLPTVVALATAVVHMGSAPVAARLTIVNIRISGMINFGWAVLVAGAATRFVPAGGAQPATLIYLAAYMASAWFTLLALRNASLPGGVVSTVMGSQLTACVLVVLGFLRASHEASSGSITAVMLLVLGCSLAGLVLIARRHGWLPQQLSPRGILTAARGDTSR